MGKIFKSFKRKKNDKAALTIDLLIDSSTYEKLKRHALTEGVSENEELLRALRRGMSEYWLYVAKYERERYRLVEELCKRAKRDNQLLGAIINQNERFREILEEKESRGKHGESNEDAEAGNVR